jgi:hypothetical protein
MPYLAVRRPHYFPLNFTTTNLPNYTNKAEGFQLGKQNFLRKSDL